jgi:hypothetical protein
MCHTYSRVCKNQTMRVKSHSACGYRFLRVEINLVRVEITLVRVLITFMPVEITLRVEITLCEQTSYSHIHTHTCQNYTRVCEITLCGCTEKNNHFEGLFHQYFEGLVIHIQTNVSFVCGNRRRNVSKHFNQFFNMKI